MNAVPLLAVTNMTSLIDPFTALAKRIEVDTHPDGVVVDIRRNITAIIGD